MRKLYIFGLIALAALIIGLAWADQITLTTYYPAPYGVYNDIVVMNSLGIGTTNPTEILEVNGEVKIGDYTLPSIDGTNSQALQTDGSGNVSWQDVTVADNSITNAKMADDAIHQAELNTSTGSQSGTFTVNVLVAITMHDYSFFPNIYSTYAGAGGNNTRGNVMAVNDNTDSQIGRFGMLNKVVAEGYDVQWRYVAASDPEHWIFVVYNKKDKYIQHVWEAPDHPFMIDNSFPNPFDWLKNNSDYEIYLIDNDKLNELTGKVSRAKSLSKVILEEYEIDEIRIPTFESRTLIEFDKWGDRSGEIIRTFKDKTRYGKTKTLKRRMVNSLPSCIKYRSLKRRQIEFTKEQPHATPGPEKSVIAKRD